MLLEEYNQWLYDLAIPNKYDQERYSKLLSKLNNTAFNYLHPMDVNRYDDGINLRYRFGYECGYDNIYICNEVDCRECSILEMMIALALRCEENIMYDIRYGSRTSKWFFDMVSSLQLYYMDNVNFNDQYVEDRIVKFLTRSYAPDGTGGLFTIHTPIEDMREIEIWQQAMLYLTENYSER